MQTLGTTNYMLNLTLELFEGYVVWNLLIGYSLLQIIVNLLCDAIVVFKPSQIDIQESLYRLAETF